MKVKDLYEVAKYSAIELHSGFDGKMIASSEKTVEKFADAEILSIIPQIKVNKHSCDYARMFLYVYVDNNDVERIKAERRCRQCVRG
jgi:hypothetical protein